MKINVVFLLNYAFTFESTRIIVSPISAMYHMYAALAHNFLLAAAVSSAPAMAPMSHSAARRCCLAGNKSQQVFSVILYPSLFRLGFRQSHLSSHAVSVGVIHKSSTASRVVVPIMGSLPIAVEIPPAFLPVGCFVSQRTILKLYHCVPA